jgi:hypothetical protein
MESKASTITSEWPHPITLKQTARQIVHRTNENMLRAYVAPNQADWDEHLIAAEFAYNNSVQASTCTAPFYPLSWLSP